MVRQIVGEGVDGGRGKKGWGYSICVRRVSSKGVRVRRRLAEGHR
jgi:hypothetical protein